MGRIVLGCLFFLCVSLRFYSDSGVLSLDFLFSCKGDGDGRWLLLLFLAAFVKLDTHGDDDGGRIALVKLNMEMEMEMDAGYFFGFWLLL